MRSRLSVLLLLVCSLASAQAIDSLKRVLAATKSDTVQANLHNKLAAGYRDINPDSTLWHAMKAKSISEASNYGIGIGNAYINIGNSMLLKGDYENAMISFTSARKTLSPLAEDASENSWYQSSLARSYASIGVIYSEKSDYYNALENYQKALKIYRETGIRQRIEGAQQHRHRLQITTELSQSPAIPKGGACFADQKRRSGGCCDADEHREHLF